MKLPHHVPIRKENRWEPIQHYATAPNTAIAAVPRRKPALSELLMPERQDSVSSYISQYSSQNRHLLSSKSLASSTIEGGDDDTDTTGFSPRQPPKRQIGIGSRNMMNRQSSVPSNASSPSSQNSQYESKQGLSSKSLFSMTSMLATTFEEQQKKEDNETHQGYNNTLSLSDFISSPPLARSRKADFAIPLLDDWFQHSDDSSASQDESPVDKTYSGRSMIPVTDEYTTTTPATDDTSNGIPAKSTTECGRISENIHKILREHASTVLTDETTTVSEAGSTKLDRLRERLKRLREHNHQLQKTRTSAVSQSKNVIPEEAEHPSLHTAVSNAIPKKTESFRIPSFQRTPQFWSKSMAASTTTQTKIDDPSLHRTQSYLQSKAASNVTATKTENPSFHIEQSFSTQSFSQSTNGSKQTTTPKKAAQQPPHADWKPYDVDWNLRERSPSWESDQSSSSLRSHSSCGRPERTKDICPINASWWDLSLNNEKADPLQASRMAAKGSSVLKGLMNNLREELTTEAPSSSTSMVRPSSYSFQPRSSISSSRCVSIAEDAVNLLLADRNYDPDGKIDVEPANEHGIDIHSSFDSSQCNSVVIEEAEESFPDEDLYINSSFDSSKCSSIAEEAVRSLRAERLHIKSSFDSSKSASIDNGGVEYLQAELQAEHKYDPRIHITRHYSMGKFARHETNNSPSNSSPAVSPCRQRGSPLQEKLKRGRRSKPLRSLVVVKQEETISEPRNLAQELRKALADRGPPIETEEEHEGPWCDPFPSDGLQPLAASDSLLTPTATPPRSFREKRFAYLNSIGDSDETRKTSPAFTTANWVLGKLPLPPPELFVDCATEGPKETCTECYYSSSSPEQETKTCHSRPRKWTSRKSVQKNMEKDVENAGRVSPGRDVKRWMSRKNDPAVMDTEPAAWRSRKQAPLRVNNSWATQRSFVNRGASKSTKTDMDDAQEPPSRRLVRSKSAMEKETFDKDEKSSQKQSSRRLVRRSSGSKRSVDEEREGVSRESSSSRKLVRRRSSEQSKKPSSSRCLVRASSKTSIDEEREGISRTPSSRRHKSLSGNLEVGQSSKKPLSRRLVRSSSKTSVEEEREGISRTPSSRRLLVRSKSSSGKPSSKPLVEEEREGISTKSSSRRLLVKNKSSKKIDVGAKNNNNNATASSSRGLVRDSSKSSVERERSSKQTTQPPASTRRSFSKTSSQTPSSRRLVRNSSKSSSLADKEGVAKNPGRSCPPQSPVSMRDRSATHKIFEEMIEDTTTTTTTTDDCPPLAASKKPSSWRVTKFKNSSSKSCSSGGGESKQTSMFGSKRKDPRATATQTTQATTTRTTSRLFGSRLRNLSGDHRSNSSNAPKKPMSGRFGGSRKSSSSKASSTKTKNWIPYGLLVSKSSSSISAEEEPVVPQKNVPYKRLHESHHEENNNDNDDDDDENANSKDVVVVSRSMDSALLPKPRSKKHVIIVDHRDNSGNGTTSSNGTNKQEQPFKPSSWRDAASRGVDRNHSHLSKHTETTVDSDEPSSSSNSSSSQEDTGTRTFRTKSISPSSSTTTTTTTTTNNNTNRHRLYPKHGMRTRPRDGTESAVQRLSRYKAYRKHGVLGKGASDNQRFHVDMTGGIQ